MFKRKVFVTLVLLSVFAIFTVLALPPQNIRVTYVTESKGFKHGVLPESEKIMQELGKQNGFDVTISQDSAQVITAENLKKVDVLIFYTTGELPWSDEQKKLFLDFVKNGKGFIGIHSATDTFYKWPEYGELVGGYFDGHPWGSRDKVVVQKVDKKFAVTKHWDDLFTWVEETYQYKNFNFKANKVLMSLDAQPTKMDMTKKGIRGIHAVGEQANIKPDSFPLVWYRTYGKGRVFYSEPGHNSEVWNNPKYQTMIANAIKWTAKKMK
jgi:type 1 glutamine amidotransferase